MELTRALFRNLIIICILAAVFAFLGVYDTDTLPFLSKFAYWVTIMFVGAIATALAEPWVFGRLMRDQHPLFQLAVIAALVSIPIGVGLAGVNTDFDFAWSLTNWALQFITVWVIAFIIVTGRYIAPQVLARVSPGSEKPASNASPIESFIERLPIKYRGAELYAVSSEGHYLRVHTDRGEELILMRLSDAVRELADANGLQVHRSWWVSHSGVGDIHSRNGKRTLVLKSGIKAPVSRSFLQALKDAGLDA